MPYPQVDQHVLLINREVIAASLLEQWEVPDEIATAVRFQNVGDYQGSHQSYVHLLRIAQDLLCHGENGLHQDSHTNAQALGLDVDDLGDVADAIMGSQDELGELARTMAQ